MLIVMVARRVSSSIRIPPRHLRLDRSSLLIDQVTVRLGLLPRLNPNGVETYEMVGAAAFTNSSIAGKACGTHQASSVRGDLPAYFSRSTTACGRPALA